jgi:hypothetical protein
MSKSIRIRTTPGGDDKYLKFSLEQDFDFLEILSLKLTQEEVYRRFYSDYGVVVGRVIMNNGVGIPNARVSIFIPVDKDEDNELKQMYPYDSVVGKDDDGVRYNLLPKNSKDGCHVAVGTFPSKREILDNEMNMKMFEKYYKYTAVTNNAGDFMIFGVPVGNHTINVDVDISDIGIFSQKPYDLMDEGAPKELFASGSQFKSSRNLNTLPQVKNQKTGVNVLPFWGDKKDNEIGITRIDFDLNYELKPKAIFMGSTFTDTSKNSVNKNCKSTKDTGRLCETIPNDGRISMIRKRIDGEIEELYINGSDIDDDGVWIYQIPMNLDYMVTDEFGKLIPTEEPNKGIPTRTQVRFKLDSQINGGEGRLRTRADYLIPHNPKNKKEIDYEFGEKTKDTSFRDLHWNKIYTVKNFIPRFQSGRRAESRRFVGLKDIDNCRGTKNPTPFNRLDTDFNPLYSIICSIVFLVVNLVAAINSVISWQVKIGFKVRPFCGVLRCIELECDGNKFRPDCQKSSGKCYKRTEGITSKDALVNCYQYILAESFNVYELDFYNDWLNGSLYSVLLKYKKKKKRSDKFCDYDDKHSNFLHDTLINDNFEGHNEVQIEDGLIKKYGDDLYYAPVTKDGKYKLLATDIVSLGSITSYDWEGKPSIHELIPASSFKLPPFIAPRDEDDDGTVDITPVADYMQTEGGDDYVRADGLLFNLKCSKITVSKPQGRNIKRLCELGVGLDEDDGDGNGKDGKILKDDVDNQFVRDSFILLNDVSVNSLPNNGLKSGFGESDYTNFIKYSNQAIPQTENSFYFYFGSEPNRTAIDKMNRKYFKPCVSNKKVSDA